MAITIGATVTDAIDTGASSLTTASHTPDANTKALVVVVLGFDAADADAAISSVKYGGASGQALTLCDYYRDTAGGDDAFIGIYYLPIPLTYYASGTIVVTMGGSCTDLSCSVINLVDSTADAIIYDTTNETEDSGDTSHGLTISSVVTGAMAIAGIIDTDANTSDVAPTATYGALVGTEKDFGSQVAECSYKAESGGAVDLRWTKAATDVSWAMGCTFYSVTTTVTLEDPTAGETVTDTTPPLTFHGHTTDKDTTDNIEYQLQVDTATGFNSQAATNIDYYAGTNDLNRGIYNSSFSGVGQIFLGNGKTINSCKFYLKKANSSTTGNAYAKIYKITGTPGSTAVPSGAALITSVALDVSTLTTDYSLKELTFSTTYTTEPSTYYAVAIEYTEGTITNCVYVGVKSGDSHGGNECYVESGVWIASSTSESNFYVISTLNPLVSSFSTSASGDFEAGHPWDDAEQVTYTCTTLTAGTYYWRVRGKDVATGVWGAWSTGAGLGYESFVIGAGTPGVSGNDWPILMGKKFWGWKYT